MGEADAEIPLAFGHGTQKPRMLVTDIALIADPAYRKVSQKFLDEPDTFAREFAKAWLKLTHRDMGPITRYLGADVPKEQFIWQDPVAPADEDHMLSEVSV